MSKINSLDWILSVTNSIRIISCCSGVDPVSCYQKVAGSIPLVCMSKCPLGKILNLKTAPDVLVGTLHGSHWTQVSAKYPKIQI